MIIQLDGYFSFERIKEALLSALPTTRYYEWVYDTIQTTCLENEKMTKCIGIRAHLVYKHKKFWLLGDEVFEALAIFISL